MELVYMDGREEPYTTSERINSALNIIYCSKRKST